MGISQNKKFTRPMMGLPLYLDTLFTITVTFISGPLWGVITGALTNPLSWYEHFKRAYFQPYWYF